MEWFECKVSYDKENEDGKLKKVTESYLVDGVSFTEAEAIITKEVTSFINVPFEVAAVKKEKISELFKNENGGTWFKCKIAFVQLDEISGKEKRNNVSMYIQCEKIDDVIKGLKEKLKDSVVDYEILTVVETKINDVFGEQTTKQL